MSQKSHLNQNLATESVFKLRPLVACIRALIAGGLLAGVVTPSHAELPVPAGTYTLPDPVGGASRVGFTDTVGSADWSKPNSKTLNVNQRDDKVILNWNSFNVGKGYGVKFAQPNSSSIALNRINDPSINGSQIAGTITANGQIYLVNKNGFVFGKDAVVNTSALVASALNISDPVFNRGIIREFEKDSQPGKAALDGQTGDSTDVSEQAKITIDSGAKIHVGKNGSVILAAPKVENFGAISGDEKSQIVLVASKDKVYLQPASGNSPFAGLLVEVGAGGEVKNGGDLAVREGNITLAGFTVNQEGRINATTSVDVNGSVRLLARQAASDNVGGDGRHRLVATETVRNGGLKSDDMATVTFGKQSSVKVLADVSGGSAIDEQEQKQSFVEVSANKIHMQSGSSVVATSGKVNFTATDNPSVDTIGASGRIHLESGSRIDVSGTKNVKIPIERNVADVSVQSFNLRDAPYQRGGVLQGKTVKVDIRKDTKIVDASGASAGIKRGIAERLAGEIKIKNTKGEIETKAKSGEINLTSGSDVVVDSGASTDISGGSVRYQDGYINTSKLLSSTGKIVDISDADPNETYLSVFGTVIREHSKWGVTEKWDVTGGLGLGFVERGYTEGKVAGSLNIQSPLTFWNGQVKAGTVSSIYQRNKPLPGGSFRINGGDNGGSTNPENVFLSSQNVLFQSQQPTDIDVNAKEFPTSSDGKAIDLIMSTALLNQSGLSEFTVKTRGKVILASDATLSMPAANKFSLNVDATSIDVQNAIYSPGGSINLNSIFVSGLEDSGKLDLASTSVLDVSGRWINDFQKGLTATLDEPVIIDSGSVALKAQNNLNFNKGAEIKADGGGWLASNGTELTTGKAGTIELAAGTSDTPGLLSLNGILSAFSLNDGVRANPGGTLKLASGKISIGSTNGEDNVLNLGVTNGNFDIAAQSGFSNITLTSNRDDITVRSGTDLRLFTQNRILAGNKDLVSTNFGALKYAVSGQVIIGTEREQASAKSIPGSRQVIAMPDYLSNPLNLTLDGKKGVTLETGSTIRLDKESEVKISSSNIGRGVYIDGLVSAPAGKISVELKSDQRPGYDPTQSIWLGSNGSLTTLGASRLNPVDPLGRTNGDVLSGGTVTLTANRGYVVLEEGSKIDVSGTRASLDLPVSNSTNSGIQFKKQNIGSDAGKINITAAEAVILDGTFNAKAGSANNKGGRLDLTLDRNQRNEPDDDPNFPVQAQLLNLVQDSKKELPTGLSFGSKLPGSIDSQATISSEEINKAGFDDLHLAMPNPNTARDSGAARFLGDVNLTTASSITFDTPNIDWSGLEGAITGVVNVNTAYLKLGSSTTGNITKVSQLGGGKLTTNSTWTQLSGAALLTGFNQVNLNSNHDMRVVGVRLPRAQEFTGNLNTAANLNLNAGQIYPTSLTNYRFAVTSPDGQLTISGGNKDTTPLSAAGQLTFSAATINQNGVIKAPLGKIELDASSNLSFGNGSLTSVSADNKIIPIGEIAGNFWKYSLDTETGFLVFNELPNNSLLGDKRLVFNSPDIEFKLGSVIDVSGNGDLLAFEFQPGLGGSFDYLDPNSVSFNKGSFAILPSLGSSLAPFDYNFSNNFANLGVDPRTQIHLAGSASLAAGNYTMLPARYALLPGAFLVSPQGNTQDQILSTRTKFGLPIVSGYTSLAGSTVRDSRLNGYLVETRDEVRKQSAYDIQTANNFFTRVAAKKEIAVPVLPIDSGQVSIDASARLVLDGQFKVAAPNGRGAKLDISSNDIKIVKNLRTSGSTGVLEILDQQLSNLNVDSLLLGGKRTLDNLTGETNLDVKANNVTFEQGSNVKALDLVVAGKNSVVVKNGATITSSGTVNTGESTYNIVADSNGSTGSALLRVSADKQIVVNRPPSLSVTPVSTGSLTIEQGAVLSASKSMLLDASKSTTFDGKIEMKGGALSLTAKTINLGDITGQQNDSLNLSNQQLAGFTVDDFLLKSQGAINFYGNVGNLDGNGKLVPLQFKNLVLNASSISGNENNGKTAKLQANSILVQNPDELNATPSTTGTGTLELKADQYSQGVGNFGFNGFKSVNIIASEQFSAGNFGADKKSAISGVNSTLMKVESDLNLTAASFTTLGGYGLKIDATGHDVILNGNGRQAPTVTDGFGGSILVDAKSVALNNANILLPSGSVKLTAQTDDVLVNGNSNINLAGRAVNFADVFDYTSGGTFSAVATQGKIVLSESSTVDVSAGGGKAIGGNLIFKAPIKTLDLLGNIKATGGSATIDVANFSATLGFDSLMNKLSTAGVSDTLYFRTHNENITQAIGNQVKVNSLTLVSDNGAIDLSGELNANGLKEGGTINLYAGKKITLENGALLTAKGAEKGGKVLLSSVDSLTPDQSGIELKTSSIIDVSGSSANTGGKVVLSALRTADNNVNIKPIAGSVIGASQFFAEGVKKYNNADIGNDGSIDSADIAKITGDATNIGETASYMAAAAQNVATTLGSGIRLRPGVEIDSIGNLTLAQGNDWDFSNQRFGLNLDIAGSLIISSTGKLDIKSSLTDGYRIDPSDGLLKLKTDESWSFQLVAGADQSSADNFSTIDLNNSEKIANSTAKDLTIGDGINKASVHTGTGDIKLATGGDFVLSNQTSTVYNAGKADINNTYGAPGVKTIAGEFPMLGGDVVIRSGDDIKGAISNQLLSGWFTRQGGRQGRGGVLLTTWAVDASQFEENIGSFGGGKVDIAASGNIYDLSVMMPITGKQLGTNTSNSNVQIQGGGQMNVKASGDILGGAFFLGKGDGRISAGGQIMGSDKQFSDGPQLVMSGDQGDSSGLGNSKMNLSANQGIKIAAVSDAMTLTNQSASNVLNTMFFSYTDKSLVALKSLSGDVHFGSNTRVASDILGISNVFEKVLSQVYPASLDVTAFSGSVKFDHDINVERDNGIILFPSATSSVSVLAKQDISPSDGRFSIIMSDVDPKLLPNVDLPPLTTERADKRFSDAVSKFSIKGITTNSDLNSEPVDTNLFHAIAPIHANQKDDFARFVTQVGDIDAVYINVPMQAIIQAGRDIKNSPLIIQQVNPYDASIISAGRDLVYNTSLTDKGVLDTSQSLINRIEIAGPGDVTVKTGRNLDLGASAGLTTVGNIYNNKGNLPKEGASLDILVGLNAASPSYAEFIDKYKEKPLYADKLNEAKSVITEFMRKRLGNPALSDIAAFTEFKSLKNDQTLPIQAQLNALLSQVFFNELKVAGSASASDKSVGNKGGYDAIDTLFPSDQWKGDLSMFFSKIQTLSGGDINLYAPGGQVNAGLAVAPGESEKSASELGIVVQREGQINAFVKDDFTVNTSRVFTIGGGDLLIWSSDGNIDAGKGAKSALSVTPGIPTFDEKGVLRIPPTVITGGSGIRTASSGESSADVSSARRKRLSLDKSPLEAGDVFLFAPKGVVDAGEAGIAGNNVTISAVAVLGANNIQAGGVATGVPKPPPSEAAALTGTSNLSAGVTQVAEAAMAASNKDKTSQAVNAALGLVTVDVLGFGEN